jgi:hypothetical protein
MNFQAVFRFPLVTSLEFEAIVGFRMSCSKHDSLTPHIRRHDCVALLMFCREEWFRYVKQERKQE